MEEQGEFLIPAPRAEVWDTLQKPEVLQRCIDGCTEMTAITPQNFECVVTVKIGPVKARFKGEVEISDSNPPESYVLTVKAQSSGAGFGNGSALVKLADEDNSTRLTYVVQGTLGGKLAQIGTRLIKSFSRKMTKNFFERLAKEWVTT